jgi:GNAT superfamily N-acetyltransferase
MSEAAPVLEPIAAAVELGLIGPDDLSNLRAMHTASFRRHAAEFYTEDEIAAFAEHVYGAEYCEKLLTAVHRQQLIGAWLGGELVGSAGWTGVGRVRTGARIGWVFVRPFFARLGIGRKLVETTERQAAFAGFGAFSVCATLNAAGFFARLGYRPTSCGRRALGAGQCLGEIVMRKGEPASAGAAV